MRQNNSNGSEFRASWNSVGDGGRARIEAAMCAMLQDWTLMASTGYQGTWR